MQTKIKVDDFLSLDKVFCNRRITPQRVNKIKKPLLEIAKSGDFTKVNEVHLVRPFINGVEQSLEVLDGNTRAALWRKNADARPPELIATIYDVHGKTEEEVQDKIIDLYGRFDQASSTKTTPNNITSIFEMHDFPEFGSDNINNGMLGHALKIVFNHSKAAPKHLRSELERAEWTIPTYREELIRMDAFLSNLKASKVVPAKMFNQAVKQELLAACMLMHRKTGGDLYLYELLKAYITNDGLGQWRGTKAPPMLRARDCLVNQIPGVDPQIVRKAHPTNQVDDFAGYLVYNIEWAMDPKRPQMRTDNLGIDRLLDYWLGPKVRINGKDSRPTGKWVA